MLKLKWYGVDPGDEWDLAEQFDDWISQAISGECKSITAERDALRATNDRLRAECIGYLAVWAAAHARRTGLPRGALDPIHYDRLAELGASMLDFTRAVMKGDSHE